MGFNITPKPETTLDEMLSFNLDRYLEELQEIASKANKEFSLEKVRWNYIRSEINVVFLEQIFREEM